MSEIVLFLLVLSFVLILESKQTIHSLLGLIAVFILGALSFINVGAEFIGLVFIIVYVGAVGMFFLFMIMLLNQSERLEFRGGRVSLITILGVITVWANQQETLIIFKDVFIERWIEDVFVSNDVGSISYILYELRGLTLLVLGVLLFKSMIVAIDIAKSRM